MVTNIVTKISEISSMIDGLDIAIVRVKELREKCNLNVTDWTINEGQNLAFDMILKLLNNDKAELEASMKALQKEL